MIQIPQVTIENDATSVGFGASHYRIKIVVPGEIGETIGTACTNARSFMFAGVSSIAGQSIEVFDYEFDDDGLVWASTLIGDISTGVMRNDDGSFTLSLVCEKQAEGDDRYDYHGYEQSMQGKLPDNFWIEPAAVMRMLIAATVH